MQQKKDPSIKYTDMCIYIDGHMAELVDGKHKDVEEKVYNYLQLLTKALAIKGRMFKNFQDYDGYAFFAATRIFFAIKRNYENQGKIVKGKEIKPIKSCLNYTKALLNPMRVDYMREAFRGVTDAEADFSKFDTVLCRERMKQQAIQTQGNAQILRDYLIDIFTRIPDTVRDVVKHSPFQEDSVDFKRLQISILLNCIADNPSTVAFEVDPVTTLLWKFPKTMGEYVKVLLNEVKADLRRSILDCTDECNIDETLLDMIISNQPEVPTDYEG